jgi:hypothetical protein
MTQEDFDWWTPLLDSFDFVSYHTRLRADATHEYRTARHPGPEASGLDPATRPDLNVGDGLGSRRATRSTLPPSTGWPGTAASFLARTGLVDTCTAAVGCSSPGAIDKLAVRSGGGISLEATAHSFPRSRFTDAAGDDLSDHRPWWSRSTGGRPSAAGRRRRGRRR